MSQLEQNHANITQQLVAFTGNVEEKAKYIEDLKGKKVIAKDKCKDHQKNIESRNKQIESAMNKKEQAQMKKEEKIQAKNK